MLPKGDQKRDSSKETRKSRLVVGDRIRVFASGLYQYHTVVCGPLSRDVFYSMDYISHGGTLLDPESWYFHQYGAFNEDDSPNDVPHLEVIITRYPLDILAEMRAEEWSRQKFNNSGDYQQFDVLDECLYAKREGRTHVNEITGEPRVFLPGGILVLRRGDTVLFADYYGEQDLSEHIEHFAQMLMDL